MITQLAIKNHVLTLSLIALLLLSGIAAFNELPRDDMPSFLIRNVSVVTSYPGASPERVENLITDIIEKALQEVAEVDYINSESRSGVSIVSVAIKETESNLQPIFDRLRRKVDGVKSQLPDGARVNFKDELGDVFGIIIGLTAEGYSYEEMKQIADAVRDDFIRLPSVAKVQLSGVQEERIYVEFDASRLAEMGLTQKKVQDVIATTNIIMPGGSITAVGRVIIVEPTGSFEALDDLKNVIVAYGDNAAVRLRDVASIRRGYVEPRQNSVSINGEPGLAIAINLINGGNIILMGQEVDEKLNTYRAIYPHGVDFHRVASQDLVVENSVDNFVVNLLQSVVVVLVVMLFFLGLRTGLVVASLIPIAIVCSLLLMSIFEVGLNKVTLASLIIALGMLVDNSIVMSESIIVKVEKGAAVLDAAIASANELIIPLLTSSLTTSAAFMAFFLADSVMGEIMGNIFIVLTFALLSSWFLSITMIALFCVYVLKMEKAQESGEGLFEKMALIYRRLLVMSLRRPIVTIMSAVIMFFISMQMLQFVPNIFMAKSDRALVTVNVELPLGTSIDRTQGVVDQVEAMVEEKLLVDGGGPEEGVVNWSSYVGEGAPKYDLGYLAPESSPHAAHILLNTSSDSVNDTVINQVEKYIFENFPDATYKVSRLVSGGGSANPIEVRLSGIDTDALLHYSQEIKNLLRQIPGTKGVSDNWGMRSKKLVIDIDPDKAQRAGVSHQDIATSLQTMLGGKQSGVFRDGEKAIPIIMQNLDSAELNLSDLDSLNIFSQHSGKSIPLTQVANVGVAWQATKVIRRDLNRTVTVISSVQAGYTASEIVEVLKPKLDELQITWPSSYSYTLGGDAEGSSSAMGAVIAKIPLSIFVIILLLIAQFNSIRKPLIILATIPLGMIGVVFGLLVGQSYFGFMAFLGVIALAGIIINNGIVLLDRIEIEQVENNRDPYSAIVEAALQRFRPILLTTATTSLGLIPLWLGGGLMWEPMAISIIFGLIFATALTLLFVPVMYKLLFRVPHVE